MEAEAIFQTRLYRSTLDIDNEALLADIKAWREADPEGLPRSNGGASWHSQINAWERPAFASLVQGVLDAATELLIEERAMGGSSARLTSMWVNWLDEGGYNSVHGHGNTVLSGVYYVAGSGPPLALLDPSPAAHALGIQRQGGSKCHYTEPTKAGKLLMFPGYVQHYVDPHPGPGPRISVSFNINQAMKSAKEKPARPSFVAVPGLLNEEDLTRVYAQIAGRDWYQGTFMGQEGKPDKTNSVRNNDVLFVDAAKEPEWAWLHEKIAAHAKIVNDATYKLDISGGAEKFQFARYGPGERYTVHTDCATSGPLSNRTLTCVVTLRLPEEGGGTEFPDAKEPPPPQRPGDALFFPGDERHAGIEVQEGVRETLVVWLNGRAG